MEKILKVTRATKSETEAALESRAREALVKVLPWLAKHKIVSVDSAAFTLRA